MNLKLLDKIWAHIEKKPSDPLGYEDAYSTLLTRQYKKDYGACLPELKRLANLCIRQINKTSDPNFKDVHRERIVQTHKNTLRLMARADFESFMLYTEWNRDIDKQFYLPRRKVLRPVVKELQRLADDELELLGISMPPSSGKSTLALFYLTWLAGRNPEKSILTGSHSNAFVRGAYDEILRMLDPDGEYSWGEVFPGQGITKTNAKDFRINLGRPKRFETFQFTSVGTGNAGLYRAQELLYCDDLISGIEIALSPDRLAKLWEVYGTDLRQRKQGKCKELHIATRWSVHDVMGRLEAANEGNPKAKFIRLSAMDENDESNFDYPYDLGFTTETFRKQRDIMDPISWRALYENEPIEREGLLYPPESLRRFFALPDGEPDAIIGVCDTKDRGTDYAVLPVAMVYGKDYYITNALCDNNLPEIVDNRIVDILLKNKVQMCQFESNSAGGRVAKDVAKELKARGGITQITTKYTTANKETKIIVNSGWVKEHCLFWDESCYQKGSEYSTYMKFLTGYTMAGKNRHDDVPDTMAMLALFSQSFGGQQVEIFDRPF